MGQFFAVPQGLATQCDVAGDRKTDKSAAMRNGSGWLWRGYGDMLRPNRIRAVGNDHGSKSELFIPTTDELALAQVGVGVDPRPLRDEFDRVLAQVLHAAELVAPQGRSIGSVGGRAGRHGVHTEALGPLLAEMQGVAREHPEGKW